VRSQSSQVFSLTLSEVKIPLSSDRFMVITTLKCIVSRKVRIYIYVHLYPHTQVIWDATITPSWDEASSLATLMGLCTLPPSQVGL
jgi:hypothetical protein